MPEIKQLTRVKPITTSVDLGDGDSVSITFNANKITPAWMKEADKRDTEKDILSLPKALSEVILKWDITEDGQPFGHSPENIAVFSYPAQQALMLRIIEAAVPSRAEGEASSSPSPAPSTDSMQGEQTHQNGAATSPSPELSTSPSPT